MIFFLPILAGILGRSALGAIIARGSIGEMLGGMGGGKGLVGQVTNLFQGVTKHGGTVQNILNSSKGGPTSIFHSILNAAGQTLNPGQPKQSPANVTVQSPQGQQQGIGGILNKLATLIVGRGPQTATPDPATMPGLSPTQMMSMMGQSQQDIQQAHQDAQQQQAQDQAVTTPGNGGLLGGAASVVRGLIPLEGAALTAVKGLDLFGEAVLDSQKGLRRFNGQIDYAFNRLEVQQFRLSGQTANATSGSTTGLASALESFNEEFQPVKEDIITLVNTVATAGVHIARALVFVEKFMPLMQLLHTIADYLEPDKTGTTPALRKILRDLRDGKLVGGPAAPLPPL